MICRHQPGDRNCTSQFPEPETYAPTVYTRSNYSTSYASTSSDPGSPDPNSFEIEELEAVGTHLVVKARYPNCSKCAYEGNKVMVFFNATYKDAAKWRIVDPHFRDPKKHTKDTKTAPPPDARFPASLEGWQNALKFARLVQTYDR